MDLQTFSTLSGLIALGITLAASIVGGFYVVRSNVTKSASEAQQSAITAMQSELSTLRNRVTDTERDNVRCQQIVQTISAALRARGVVISIQGEMVNIREGRNTTTTKIKGHFHTEETEKNEEGE
jgi:hypothetical protein